MKSFLFKLLLLAAVVTTAYALLGNIVPARFYFVGFYAVAGLFILVTLLFHLGLQKSFEKGSKNFIRYYMGATGLKLLLFLIIILIYAFVNKAGAVGFALCFFFYYFTFTAFEVIVANAQFGRVVQDEKEKKAMNERMSE